MSEQDSNHNTILSRDMLPMLPRSADRLPPMLFVAALFYAMIILGVTFDLGLDAPDSDTTTLEVTIVAETNQRIARPEDADYLAQANQAGRGNTEESVRASAAPAAPAPVAAPAEELGNVQPETAPGDDQAARLLTTTETADRAVFDPEEISPETAAEQQVAQTLPEGLEETLPLPTEDLSNLLIRDDNPRHLTISVTTRRSDIAPYLDRWKRRVERVGTLNFPREINITGLTGSPTLGVAIDPEGMLADIEILRTSGYPALDRAALSVLHRAAPFERFSPELRERYDLLRFAYKFEFRGGEVTGSTRAGP
jgi:protein TonB